MDRETLLNTRGGIPFKEVSKWLALRGIIDGRNLFRHEMADGEQHKQFVNLDTGAAFEWAGNSHDAHTLSDLLDWAELPIGCYGDCKDVAKELDRLGFEPWARIRRILSISARRGPCRGCGRPMFWIGASPYSTAGIIHFIDCPKRDQFKKKKGS